MAEPSWLGAGGPAPPPEQSAAGSGPTFKVILVGEVGVGKTSLFSRAHHPQHVQRDSRASATIGVDTCTRTLPTRCGNVTVSQWAKDEIN